LQNGHPETLEAIVQVQQVVLWPVTKWLVAHVQCTHFALYDDLPYMMMGVKTKKSHGSGQFCG